MHSIFPYCIHLAKLSRPANKQTLFMAHLLCRMEDGVVKLSAIDKRFIVNDIDSGSVNPGRMADQYLNKLRSAGLIEFLGRGKFAVNTAAFGDLSCLSDSMVSVYETRVFTSEGEREIFIEIGHSN